MSMGRWSDGGVQGELFLTSGDFPRSPGHVFYDRLNRLLAEAKFTGYCGLIGCETWACRCASCCANESK